MSYKVPKFIHPELPQNKLGYTKKYYEGGLSTLCAGCGHDSISAAIALACYEMSIEPHKVANIKREKDYEGFLLKYENKYNKV